MLDPFHRSALFTALLSAAFLPRPAAAFPLISEVFYDAIGSDNGHSFIELYGAPGTSLEGLVLEGVNGSGGGIGPVITLAGVIPEDGLFVVADRDTDGVTFVPEADFVQNFDFQNGPDSVVLRSDAGVIDAIGYGDFGPGDFFAGEGAPAPDAPDGTSLARVFANIDTDDNAADFQILDFPSPGSADLAVVPEPSTLTLALSGLVGIGLIARRRRN